MEELLQKELLLTRALHSDPSEENRIKLLNVKKEMMMMFNASTNTSVKKACEDYVSEHNEKLVTQYNHFLILVEYLKDKEDVSELLKIIDDIKGRLL